MLYKTSLMDYLVLTLWKCLFLKGNPDPRGDIILKKGCENLGFVVFRVKWPPRKVSTVYRRRFAIESSYWIRNMVKPKISSKNTNIRYFYTLISFLLKNIWLYLQKKHFTIVKRGPQVRWGQVHIWNVCTSYWGMAEAKVKGQTNCGVSEVNEWWENVDKRFYDIKISENINHILMDDLLIGIIVKFVI